MVVVQGAVQIAISAVISCPVKYLSLGLQGGRGQGAGSRGRKSLGDFCTKHATVFLFLVGLSPSRYTSGKKVEWTHLLSNILSKLDKGKNNNNGRSFVPSNPYRS